MRLRNGILIIVFFLGVGVAGCSLLTPITSTDSQGNSATVAKGSQYLETAQGVLGIAGGFPMFGGIATGIAGLLGVATVFMNSAARKRAKALEATVIGVNTFAENYTGLRDNIVSILAGIGQEEAAADVKKAFDKNESVKDIIQEVANSKGVESFLHYFVKKTEAKA